MIRGSLRCLGRGVMILCQGNRKTKEVGEVLFHLKARSIAQLPSHELSKQLHLYQVKPENSTTAGRLCEYATFGSRVRSARK